MFLPNYFNVGDTEYALFQKNGGVFL